MWARQIGELRKTNQSSRIFLIRLQRRHSFLPVLAKADSTKNLDIDRLCSSANFLMQDQSNSDTYMVLVFILPPLLVLLIGSRLGCGHAVKPSV